MSRILGLDISTSCTGWCVIDSNGVLVKQGYIDLKKQKSLFSKAGTVADTLSIVHLHHEITSVYIEENLQSFRRGFSSAQTLSTLAKFNGIVSFLCFKQFDFEPSFLNVNAARKSLGIKLVRKKEGGAPTKEQILEWVNKDLESQNIKYDWPYKVMKSGPRKGQTILRPECFDMADAYVIANAGFRSTK